MQNRLGARVGTADAEEQLVRALAELKIVGQDGILPPVGNRRWPIANRPQLNKLPHRVLALAVVALAGAHAAELADAAWVRDTGGQVQTGPGGKVILGNFDPRCPDRAFLDHLLEWRLIYRSPDDMRRLFACSKFGDRPVDIRFEQEGINLFASCCK